MPIIARFYGLVIKMFLIGSEHNPPHIHVVYGEFSALYNIQTLELMEGDLPSRAAAMVKEWLSIHKDDLMEMWNSQKFKTLPPLK
ncbi:MAG: DUF4160 domain-containing protein [Alphaproteobacteria bacterium]|nr:DUF4160 domain-containing protein [Alphaproteobacteria bacterium]